MADRRHGPRPHDGNEDRHPLARWRLLRGMTQEQLAERARVGRVTIARIEQGAEPRVRTALRLAGALAVKVEDVWTVDGATPRALMAAERKRGSTA
jgi:transcriptional regulator with XRE-family HTH domain